MDQYVIALILGVIEGITECIYQMLCLWPGFSRSGATIAGGMLIGCTRSAAADFSFIMAVPVFILLWVLSDNSGYISNYLSLSMIANEEKMKFKKFRKNTCIGYRFMLL